MERTSSCRRVAPIAFAILIAGCASYRPAPPPINPPVLSPKPPGTIVGMASWYGPGFNGRRTATGQIYNQEELTAASNSFPLGSHVMVTNLDNGRSVEVVINDRGPFKKGRKIDLSHAAARSIGMLGTGTTRVSLAPLHGAQPQTAIRYYVQAGSFSRPDRAEQLRDALLRHYSDARIYTIDADGRRFYRVRMGAFTNREEAAARARQAARLGFPMIIVSQ